MAAKNNNGETLDFLWIEGMSKKFSELTHLDFDAPDLYRFWHLQVLLAIAQQLSVISATLKKDLDEKD